jgi:hypothetical protein
MPTMTPRMAAPAAASVTAGMPFASAFALPMVVTASPIQYALVSAGRMQYRLTAPFQGLPLRYRTGDRPESVLAFAI